MCMELRHKSLSLLLLNYNTVKRARWNSFSVDFRNHTVYITGSVMHTVVLSVFFKQKSDYTGASLWCCVGAPVHKLFTRLVWQYTGYICVWVWEPESKWVLFCPNSYLCWVIFCLFSCLFHSNLSRHSPTRLPSLSSCQSQIDPFTRQLTCSPLPH